MMAQATDDASLSPLAALLENCWNSAATVIGDSAQEMPLTITAQDADGEISVYILPNLPRAARSIACDLLSRKFRLDGVRRYTVLMETWAAEYIGEEGDDTQPDFKLPSERADRIEALTALGVDPEAGELISCVAEIVTIAPGRRALKATKSMMHGADCMIEGIWSTLLGPIKQPVIN